METFSALLALCAGISPVAGEIPAQRPVTRSFDVFCDLRLNKRLSKQSWGWWFETPSSSLWRHRNVQGLSRADVLPSGDPSIQTSCSLSGRVEYTPLGLDGSMVSNGKLFKWLMHHILNIHFSENTSTIYPCIHWPVVQKWTHKFISYITKQETFQWNSSTVHPDGSHVG